MYILGIYIVYTNQVCLSTYFSCYINMEPRAGTRSFSVQSSSKYKHVCTQLSPVLYWYIQCYCTGQPSSWTDISLYIPPCTTSHYSGEHMNIWNLAIPYNGFLSDIGSPTDTILGHVSRYWGFLLTRYRDMSDVTRYRVPMLGTHLISGHHFTNIVNHIPDIGINIWYKIGCPYIGDMISRYCVNIGNQYRVSRYRGMIATDIVVNIRHYFGSFFWCSMPTMRSLCKAANPRGELQGAKNMVNRKNKELKLCLFLPEQRNQSLYPEIFTPCRDSNPEPLPSKRHALPLSHQAKWVAMPDYDFDGLYIIVLPHW
jgi:hypothetical protein